MATLESTTSLVFFPALGQILDERVRAFAMLWSIFAILLILWLLGFGYHIGGWLVHLLLVGALLVLIVNIVRPDALRRR